MQPIRIKYFLLSALSLSCLNLSKLTMLYILLSFAVSLCTCFVTFLLLSWMTVWGPHTYWLHIVPLSNTPALVYNFEHCIYFLIFLKFMGMIKLNSMIFFSHKDHTPVGVHWRSIQVLPSSSLFWLYPSPYQSHPGTTGNQVIPFQREKASQER